MKHSSQKQKNRGVRTEVTLIFKQKIIVKFIRGDVSRYKMIYVTFLKLLLVNWNVYYELRFFLPNRIRMFCKLRIVLQK